MAEKTYTAAQRDKATTMPDGSYPIDNVADLKRAIQAFGRGDPSDSRKAAIKAWIKKRARALGATDQLPAEWRSNAMDFETDRVEKRSVGLSEVAIDDEGRKFTGYAAIYGQIADLGEFTEEVARGAFRKVLAANINVPMYWDHDPRHPPLATTGGGTLRLAEDVRGLRVEADLDDDHYMTPTLRSMIRRGDVKGMSFGFVAGAGNSRTENRGGKLHRVLTNFKALLDVSPTWEPAYAGTSAELRSALATLRMAEELDPAQQILSGAYQRLEDGAQIENVDTDESEDKDAADATAGSEQEQEQRSGATAAAAAAARRRRLHMMGLTLPKSPVA